MLCLLYLMLCCIVPDISSEDCVDLWSDGGTVGDNLQIPEGYSLRDQLTVRGEILEGVPGKRLFVGFVKYSPLEYTMYTTLSPKGRLVVKTGQRNDVLKIDGQVTPGVHNSLLLRMICNETTCSVTSPGNLNVESFNHQQTLPDLLSTDRIRVMKNENISVILSVQSITFCKVTEPDTEKGDRNSESGDDESGDDDSRGDEPGIDESEGDDSGDDESGSDELGGDESPDEKSGGDESEDVDSGSNFSGGEESGGKESESDDSGEVCKFLGPIIRTRQVFKFPDNFNMSDVLTVKANIGTAENGHLFHLYEEGRSANKWQFLLENPHEFKTYGVFYSGEDNIPLLDQGMRSVMKIQVFHNITADILSIITPKSTTKIDGALDTILKFNTIQKFTPINFGLYEYISICRPKEPEVELTVPPQPYTLGSTVTLQCTITGPPFLSGYWTKDNTVVISSRTTELQSVLDESEAEHKLELKLIVSRFHVNSHLGLYGCHADSSITAPNKNINQSIEVSYSAPINITEPTSTTFNLLPKTFTWRVEGYPIRDVVQLECSAGKVTRSYDRNYTIRETIPYLFHVAIGEEWDGEQFNCTLKNGEESLQTLRFSKCGDGNYIEEGGCLSCPEGQSSRRDTNYTCVEEEREKSNSSESESGDSGSSESHDGTGGSDSTKQEEEVCQFLGQSEIRNYTDLNFPESFNMSDILTVEGDYGDSRNSWIFHLYDKQQLKKRWKFYITDEETLTSFGMQRLGSMPLNDKGMGAMLRIQMFYDRSAGTFKVMTPKATETIRIGENFTDLLQINTVEILEGVSYEYISICRPKEPGVELSVPPQPYKLGSPVTLQCTITGPPFLSGYWKKDNTAVISSETTELQSVLDESEAEHRLVLKLVISSFSLRDLGLYGCHANSSIMDPNKAINKTMEISSVITEPVSRTSNLLPETFICRVEGHLISNFLLRCTEGEVSIAPEDDTESGTAQRSFHVTIGEKWDGEQFICTLKNGEDSLQTYLFSKCGDGNYIEKGVCLSCPKGQTSGKHTNYTCVEKKEEAMVEIIGGLGGAVFLIVVAVVTGILVSKKRRKRSDSSRRTPPGVHFHNSGDGSEVTYSNTLKLNTATRSGPAQPLSPVATTEPLDVEPPEPVYSTINKPVNSQSATFEADAEECYSTLSKPANPKPATLKTQVDDCYSTLSKPANPKPATLKTQVDDCYSTLNRPADPEPCLSETEVDDLYSTVNKPPPEPEYADADHIYSDIGLSHVEEAENEEEAEDEEECKYADLEFVGRERSATGSVNRRVEERPEPTYVTVAEFQIVEETEEDFGYSNI